MNNSVKKAIVFIIAFMSFSGVMGQETILKDIYHKTVAQDGTGDYTTIQDAVNDCKSFPDKRITIFVKNGRYHEKVKIHEWNPDITLIGESRENTIIAYDDYFGKINSGINSTFQTYTMLVEGDGFIAQNLTIENTSGEVGQAIALSIHANNAAIFNCRILGNQDTLYASGNGFKVYLQNCFIQGTTDFIFGGATAYFKNCTLYSLKDSYITAPSTPQAVTYGFIFDGCRLTADKSVTKTYLGRPWRVHAKTVFINCSMDGHIAPEGWHNWNKPEAEKTSFYAEYNCSGPGYKRDARVGWSHQLKAKQAKEYSIENCLGAAFAKTIAQWNAALKQ